MRRCTGFSPARAAGSAPCMMVEMAWGREGGGQIALLERLAQRDLLHAVGLGGNHFLVHGRQEVARSWPANKPHFPVAELGARLSPRGDRRSPMPPAAPEQGMNAGCSRRCAFRPDSAVV